MGNFPQSFAQCSRMSVCLFDFLKYTFLIHINNKVTCRVFFMQGYYDYAKPFLKRYLRSVQGGWMIFEQV